MMTMDLLHIHQQADAYSWTSRPVQDRDEAESRRCSSALCRTAVNQRHTTPHSVYDKTRSYKIISNLDL